MGVNRTTWQRWQFWITLANSPQLLAKIGSWLCILGSWLGHFMSSFCSATPRMLWGLHVPPSGKVLCNPRKKLSRRFQKLDMQFRGNRYVAPRRIWRGRRLYLHKYYLR